jgi:CheY-like chemotaxis protein
MSPHRVLIVEDQREVSRLVHAALETLGASLEVVETPSGEEALLDSSHNLVDMLVADYRLPGMTGVELMHKVQKIHPRVKTILVTGQTDPGIRKEVAEAGADAYFIKPIPMADFLGAVEHHLHLVEKGPPTGPLSIKTGIQRGLPDLLAGLRREMTATSVLLLNDTGRILARAGDLPNQENEVALISSLLTIYSAEQKVSRLLGQKITSTWYVFDRGANDLVFAPVGLTHAMLVFGKGIAAEGQLLKTTQMFSEVRTIIEQVIGETARNISVPQPSPSAPPEGIEPLFNAEQKKPIPEIVNDFWSKAADTHKPPSNPDMLTYEQAKQLGLAPKDES